MVVQDILRMLQGFLCRLGKARTAAVPDIGILSIFPTLSSRVLMLLMFLIQELLSLLQLLRGNS